MKRAAIMLSLVAAGGLFAARPMADDKKEEAKLPVCPVMGGEVNFSVHTATDDGPVYFCCPGCIAKFNKNPEKYAEETSAQRKALAKMDKVQVSCPVTGEELDASKTIEHEGEKVAFCCGGCVRKFQKDPAKYKASLAASYTYQTKCPVSGERIDTGSATTLPTGETIYFCCDGCIKKLLAEPEKYAENLAKQGMPINPAKIKEAQKSGQGG